MLSQQLSPLAPLFLFFLLSHQLLPLASLFLFFLLSHQFLLLAPLFLFFLLSQQLLPLAPLFLFFLLSQQHLPLALFLFFYPPLSGALLILLLPSPQLACVWKRVLDGVPPSRRYAKRAAEHQQHVEQPDCEHANQHNCKTGVNLSCSLVVVFIAWLKDC